MTVFSHGYGVKRDSKGLFSTIAETLPEDQGFLLFDYYDINRLDSYAPGMKVMAHKLAKKLLMVSETPGVKEIHLVGHSMGCILICLAKLPATVTKVTFLAPPLHSFNKRDFRAGFVNYHPGSYVEDKNNVVIPRKNGGKLTLSADWIDDMANADMYALINKFCELRPVNIIEATEDTKVGDHSRYAELAKNPNVTLRRIQADHNFTNDDVRSSELIN